MSAASKNSAIVTIKGTANGLLIRLRDDAAPDFGLILTEVGERLTAGEKFFRKGKASVEMGNREVNPGDLEQLQKLLAEFEIELETIISGANATRSLARQAGIAFKLPNKQNTRPIPLRPEVGNSAESARNNTPFDSAEALFVRRTLRSGQVLRHHSDVIVMGDVNPGSEIEAGGSVIVWGTVRGKIQAGMVNPNSVICALNLQPTQLGIGTVVAVGSGVDSGYNGPEMAIVDNQTIMVENWTPHRGRMPK